MPRHRVLFIAALLLFPFLLAEARLLYLQGWAANDYREMILRKRTGVALLPLPRGRILDRHGAVLAADLIGFDLRVRLGDFDKDPDSGFLLCRLLDARPEEIVPKIQALRARIEQRAAEAVPKMQKRVRLREMRTAYPLLENIPFRAAIEIEAHPELFPGLDVDEKLRRRYPMGRIGAHVVGVVGKINDREYKSLLDSGFFREELGESVGDREYEAMIRTGVFLDEVMGRAGIESRFQKELRGRRGAVLRERDTETGEMRIMTAAATRPGRDVRLTIDAAAQSRAEEALARSSTGRGAIVALDVDTGEVLVLASAPGYDPNDLAPPPNNEVYRKLRDDPNKPFLNRALGGGGGYPLGSVFKIVTACAALQEGKVGHGETFTCAEAIVMGGHHFDCWIFEHGGGHGPQEVTDALKHSCNIFFYNCGRRLGVPLLVRWAQSFGYEAKSGIDLGGESPGNLPDPNAQWNTGDAMNLAIGQGALLVTPLQAARMAAAIANGGKLLTPRLVMSDAPATPQAVDLQLHPEVLKLVRQGMWRVVNEDGGTGHRSGMDRFNAAGKTGTAQAPGRKPNHAWFACYFPFEKPRYAVCVFVENGGKGSEAAAPLASPVAEALMELEKKAGTGPGAEPPAESPAPDDGVKPVG